MAAASVIEARELSLTFETADGPVYALSKVNLTVHDGEFVSFIGPSGCGKTTLLRVDRRPRAAERRHGGRQRPDAGRSAHGNARQYGYVFQAPALYPWRTIEKQRHATAGDHRSAVRPSAPSGRAQQLALVNLTGFERKFPWQLSGGMQQRVSIARALSVDPG
jgi:NitT/TauT family transport system ATP-binding protein